MRHLLLAIHLLATLCVAGLSVMLNWQASTDAIVQAAGEPLEASVTTSQHQRHHDATLTDASQIYRVCSSRPQRIVPSQGSKTERTVTPSGSLARRIIVKPIKSFYDSRCRLESAPFCLSASCKYYVIALRHIIR